MTKLLIVLSLLAGHSAEWRYVADALAAKHANEANVVFACVDPTNSLEVLRRERPRYVAFVMPPSEISEGAVSQLREIVRNVDDDPFDDAIWGIVTGPTPSDAYRIASSREPSQLRTMLATTGVGEDAVPGAITVLSDAYPKGEWWQKDNGGNISRHSTTGEMVSAFVDAWNTIDPDILLTSSHATEHNLEMPFSMGMIVAAPSGDRRFAVCNVVRTPGADGVKDGVAWEMCETPRIMPAQREKVWLAAGNCLIANHVDDHDMVMTALSFGKVNQFVGYTKPTWFGFVGWNTWAFFNAGAPLSDSFFAANQWLNLKLATRDYKDEKEFNGLLWDRDATVFYGDPMQKIGLGGAIGNTGAQKPLSPMVVVFPESSSMRAQPTPPPGYSVYAADDFALFLPAPPTPQR